MKPKIITICGSIKYASLMDECAERLTLEGNCVLTIINLTKEKNEYSREEIDMLHKMHVERIKLSDAIFVVNKDQHIGNSTQKEIDFAKSLNKEVLYLENL